MTLEAGHHPNRWTGDLSGNLHLNGANLFDAGENPIAQKVAISYAKGTANIVLVSFQVQDGAGNNIANVFNVEWWLSDAASGAGLTATSASGTVGVGANGADIYSKSSKKAGEGQTDATGLYILSITDTGKTAFYPCAVVPGTGNIAIGAQLAAGNYG